jgi:hypothetical protein
MTFEEMFMYGIGGIALILAVTVGLGGFIIAKAMKKPGER